MWAAFRSLQAPVQDIYLLALKCVCAEMIRSNEGPISVLADVSNITPPPFILCLSLMIVISVEGFTLMFALKSSSWCQTSDPLSVRSALWLSSVPSAQFFLVFKTRLWKNNELHNWSWKEFPGYRGYNDLNLRSRRVTSNSICVLNLEKFLQAVMEKRQMDDKNTSGEGGSWSGTAI